jgi:hypothetical protein
MTDPAQRDRTLARVRTTTAVTGIGALVAGSVLAGWLGHVTAADATSSSTSTSTGSGGATAGAGDGLTAPEDPPGSAGEDSADSQPPVVSGGS